MLTGWSLEKSFWPGETALSLCAPKLFVMEHCFGGSKAVPRLKTGFKEHQFGKL